MTETQRRLRKGAKLLGDLWRSGVRCVLGWSRLCECVAPVDFCKAKRQWLVLVECDRDLSEVDLDAEYGILQAMVASELHETGLTLKFDDGVEVGPKGHIPVADAVISMDAPEAIPAVLQVLKYFPGAKVVKDA